MRHYLLFILAFFAFAAAKAQNPPCQANASPTTWTSGGTVTLTAFDSSASPVSSYLWSTGETSDEIVVTDPGNYCVTITYDDGCTASDCFNLSDSCYVWTWWYWINNTEMQLIASGQPYYLGSSTYLWSTGETTSSIVTTIPGNYCVTITTDYGCTASSCFDVGAPPCNLSLWEIADTSGTGVRLNASLDATGTPTYLWSNGATTSSIFITEPGTYCVTATNGTDCTDSRCITVSCDVAIQENPAGFTAVPVFGAPPFSYEWSNGATTQSITPEYGLNWVTVTDANGCTASGYKYYQPVCEATITYNSDNTLTANMTGDGPFTYEWSPGGFTTQTITPAASGNYYVTVTNANGCQDWTYEYWYAPVTCAINIFSNSDSTPVSNSVWLGAYPAGNWADWQIEWSTGSPDNQILVTTAGEYCVTATNTVSGCVATSCVWIQPDSACYVQINSASSDPFTLQLSAAGGPDPILAYAWSTGATTPTTEITETGYYGVTVTNTAGCTVSGYLWVYDANILNVQVALSDTSNIGNAGVHADIYLIEYDPAQGGILTAIDTVATYSWTNSWAFVSIQGVPPGEYLVKAALKPNSNGYADYLPTYYEEALLWSNATPVTVNAISSVYPSNNLFINLIPGQNAGGPGFIGGLVSQGANLTGSGDDAESLGEGDPFPGATVVLTLPDGTPVAAAVTNAGGEYGFENLAWGTYILTLDIPGLAPVSITVTIGPGQPSSPNVDFKVDENSIALPTQEVDFEKPVSVYPNPVHDYITVELPAPAELTLSNAQGQTVLHAFENAQQSRLSLRDLPAGIYFLSVRMTNRTQILKIMKE